ncbi:MAG: TRAM domain-containing protein [Clostridiales bacterium]|nr:TRAM domain-containing protein [Clostridiales bacterium]
MTKNKTIEKLMRFLITLLGAGVGAALATLMIPLVSRWQPGGAPYVPIAVYAALCLIGAAVCFAFSTAIIARTMRLINAIERRWDAMPTQQIVLTSIGLIMGLLVAALMTQLILSAGASLITISFSALTYVVLGYIGMQIGSRRYRGGKGLSRLRQRMHRSVADSGILDGEDMLLDEEAADAGIAAEPSLPRKFLDTSVIIDGRILDIVKTGFLEGQIVVPQFVLAELRHIADSGDSLRRARGRRGLDVLGKLQKELKIPITVDETDYPDLDEVDVKLLRLCRDRGGTVVTNDYNLNKVAGVTGIRVLNINDLANAVKPMLMAGEELSVQIVREGKEPGQGVAYLDDGTMIVVENGRRYVGQSASVIVTTVLQTSAGRMIFTKLKSIDEKAC